MKMPEIQLASPYGILDGGAPGVEIEVAYVVAGEPHTNKTKNDSDSFDDPVTTTSARTCIIDTTVHGAMAVATTSTSMNGFASTFTYTCAIAGSVSRTLRCGRALNEARANE